MAIKNQRALKLSLLIAPLTMGLFLTEPAFAQVGDSAESKRHANLLAISTDPKIVRQVLFVDMSQQLAYLLNDTGSVNKSYPVQVGKLTFKEKQKTDLRPPTGVFYLRLNQKNNQLTFESLPVQLKKAKTKTFSPLATTQKIDDYVCTSENCLAFNESDIKDLKQITQNYPLLALLNRRGEWVSEDVHQEQRKKVLSWFESWVNAWQSRDIAAYEKFYASDFSDLFFKSRSGWMERKSKIFGKYSEIKLEMGPWTLINFENYYLAQFTQLFKSNEYSDLGIKTLIFRTREDESLEIVFEDWVELKN